MDTIIQVAALAAVSSKLWVEPFHPVRETAIKIDVSEGRPENGALYIIVCW